MVFKCLYALTGVVCFCVARCAGAGPSARVCVPWTGRTGGGAWGVTESPRLVYKPITVQMQRTDDGDRTHECHVKFFSALA